MKINITSKVMYFIYFALNLLVVAVTGYTLYARSHQHFDVNKPYQIENVK